MTEKFIELKIRGGRTALVQVANIDYIVPSQDPQSNCVVYFGKDYGIEVLDTKEVILQKIASLAV